MIFVHTVKALPGNDQMAMHQAKKCLSNPVGLQDGATDARISQRHCT